MAQDAGAGAVVSFGRHEDSDMRLIECRSDVTGNAIEARWRGDALSYHVETAGYHWASNSLAVLAAADAMGANLEKAAADLATMPALRGRGAVDVIPWGEGTIRLIDDSYNASPESMSAALKTLGHIQPEGGRRVAIIGDMLELGDTSRTAHAELKDHIEKNDVDTVYLAGTEMTALAEVLDSDRVAATAETAEALLPAVLSGLRTGDVITVKASNGTGLGLIVAALTNPETSNRAANGD